MRNAHSFASESFTFSIPAGSKFILLQNPHELFVPLICTMMYICPVAYLLCVELADSHFLSDMVDTVVKVFLDFFLLFPQRYIVTLSCQGLVRRY